MKSSPLSSLINRALAEQRWPGENPIGKRVAQWPEPRLDDPWYTVIGVVGDIHETALTKTPEPTVYLPTRFLAGSSHTMFARSFWLLIETARDPLSIVSAVRGVVEEQHQAVPITSVKTVEQIKLSSIQQTSFMTVTLAASGGAALILAVVGIYSVVAYAVSGRVREFGVRIVVGARPSDIRAMVLRQGGVMGLVGVLVGLAGALGASQLLESMLFGVRGTDPGILALMSFSLLVLVMLSAWLPARRAASVDPADALKAD